MGLALKAVITVPYQPEWCRSKLILSLWFIMRVTIYIGVRLFVLFVLMDPDVDMTRAWHVSPATDRRVRSPTSHLLAIWQTGREVMSVWVSHEADVLLANLPNGHDSPTCSNSWALTTSRLPTYFPPKTLAPPSRTTTVRNPNTHWACGLYHLPLSK